MSWFLFAVLTMLLWGTADLFYKLGSQIEDRYSHLKTAAVVGTVMGIHAIITLCFSGVNYNFINIIKYLPVSACYIISMTVGYFGLKYLMLSVSSPVQNTSGAVVCILCAIILKQSLSLPLWCAIAVICVSLFWLGILERKDANINIDESKKYTTSRLAFFIPIIYCIIDALGTFFDAYYLDESTTPLADVSGENIETVANISYELTFLAVAIIIFAYLKFVKKVKYEKEYLKPARLCAAIFETAGQYTYVFAMSGKSIVAAPMVAAYSVVALFLSRIFLKEKLNFKKYLCLGLIIAGIAVIGIYDV